MLEWIIKGGPVMIPILLCSILAFAIIIERFVYLQKAKIDTKKFMDDISTSLKRNRIMEAIDMCEQTPGPIANILKSGILKHDRTRHEIREAIEDGGLHEIPKLEKNVGLLATIAHISPLLGLLGTVTGMVRAFQIVQEKSTTLNPVSPADLAGGIWEALITTVAGLIVAIPTLAAYNYFVSRVNNFILEIEMSATDLINILSEKKGE
ncbi:MAG: MotA/TolQ/ExbB proton channel family protein [Candidatus Omnitrophota bacterium]